MTSRWRGTHKAEQARRAKALDRPELRHPSEARTSPAGATSFPIKQNPDQHLIDQALARRKS